ncbi:MAG TPA: hypothetical protein VN397_05075 [Candidatus Methylomirabilis sp.]|nr:hypothetical protein [Candidatus Methylomirabilis sp.]
MGKFVLIALLSIQVVALSALPVAAQKAPSDTGALGERLKEKISAAASPGENVSVEVRGDEPPIGAAERDTEAASGSVASEPEPTLHEQDLTSGFIAAGGALLSTVLILLLVALVANSTHHKGEE